MRGKEPNPNCRGGYAELTTSTVDTYRRGLLDSLAAGTTYDFLNRAEAYLAACTEDSEIRLSAIREYLKLGLIVPAQDLLDIATPGLSASPEWVAIATSVRKLQGRIVPWSRLSDTFAANLDVLAHRHVDIEAIRESWASAHQDYQLFRDNAGLQTVRKRNVAGRWRWIPFLGDHRAVDHARPLPDDIKAILHGPYLFEGLDLGWYFRRVYDATHESFLKYSCALYVVEPDPVALALVLHLHAWQDVWSDKRVVLFVGKNCIDELTQTLQENVNLAWPSWACSLSAFRPACSPTTVKVIEKQYHIRQSEVQASALDLHKRYENRDANYWARRFDEALTGRGAPLRILSTVSRHTTFLKHSMRDAQQAFEKLGHRCVVLTEATNHEIVSPLTYHRTIRDLDPDLFFVQDHLRPEFGPIVPGNLPVMTWDQDMLPGVFTPERIRAMSPLDIIVGLPHHESLIRAGRSPRQSFFARMPTSPHQFGTEDITKNELERFRCDMSYVSHASQTAEAFHKEQYEATKNVDIRRIMAELYRIARDSLPPGSIEPDPHYLDMLVLAEQRCGLVVPEESTRDHLVNWYLWRLCDRIFRHQALEWAGRWAQECGRTLRIYGHGWENHPTLARFAAGAVENGRDLAILYRASTINLQLMPAGFTHQRALDGLAEGGFFLTRETRGDRRNPLLNAVVTRLAAMGIETGRQLLECRDESLIRDFMGCITDRYSQAPDRIDKALRRVIHYAAVDYPGDVFPRFGEIVFRDEASFSDRADFFLAHPTEREDIALKMRQAVLDRYSYPETLDQFLQFARHYFRSLVNPAPSAAPSQTTVLVDG